MPIEGGSRASRPYPCGRKGLTVRLTVSTLVWCSRVSSDTLLEGLITLAAVLGAGTTGLQIRSVSRSVPAVSISRQLPLLSMAAALFSGLALAVVGLAAAVGRWPALAQLLGGPLAGIYGLAWFNKALLESRLDAQRASGEQQGLPVDGPRSMSGSAAALMQLALSAQLGLLLCAIGVRGAVELWVAGVLALGMAVTEPPVGLQRWLRPLELRSVLHCLAGALLFALGAGTIIRQATDQRASQGFAAAWIAGVLCGVGVLTLELMRRQHKHVRDSRGGPRTPPSGDGGATGSSETPRF